MGKSSAGRYITIEKITKIRIVRRINVKLFEMVRKENIVTILPMNINAIIKCPVYSKRHWVKNGSGIPKSIYNSLYDMFNMKIK